MARAYKRDKRGRFAPKGYAGQTSGRGARLMGQGERKGGGARISTARPSGTIGKPRGLKPRAGSLTQRAAIRVSGRTRAQAAAAQRARSRATIEATRGQVIGARRGVTATAGGGARIGVRRTTRQQGNLLGGTDKVTKVSARHLPTSKGSAPGSKSARRQAGQRQRATELDIDRAKRIKRRIDSIPDRRAANPGNYFTKQRRDVQSSMTKNKAFSFLLKASDNASKHGGIMKAIKAATPAPKPARQKKKRRR